MVVLFLLNVPTPASLTFTPDAIVTGSSVVEAMFVKRALETVPALVIRPPSLSELYTSPFCQTPVEEPSDV